MKMHLHTVLLALWAPSVALLIAGCSNIDAANITNDASNSDLESHAQQVGLVIPEEKLALGGYYTNNSGLGTDKFCAIGDDGSYDIGVLAVFGQSSQCEAQGSAVQNGENVHITLSGLSSGSCEFNAHFDGFSLNFPGTLPRACSQICSDRASLAGVRFELHDNGQKNALRSKGRKFEKLCG